MADRIVMFLKHSYKHVNTSNAVRAFTHISTQTHTLPKHPRT